MSSGFARTDEGAALTARTARHFAHKVRVESDGEATVIHTRFGAATLTPTKGGVAVELDAESAADGARLREVVASHLERFARSPLVIDWHAEGR